MLRRALRVIIATVVAFVIAYLVLSNLPAFKLRETPGDADYFKNNLKHFYIFKTALALTVGVFAGVICHLIQKKVLKRRMLKEAFEEKQRGNSDKDDSFFEQTEE